MASDRVMSNMATSPVVKCMKLLLTVFNVVFSMTGIAFLAVGVWMKVSLQQYLVLSQQYYINAPFVVIGVGAVIFIIGMLGCCCTFKGQAFLLYVYSFFLVIIFVLELAAGICGFLYRPKIQDGFLFGMNSAVRNYRGEKEETIDNLQDKLSCCGVVDYRDWFDTKWSEDQSLYAVPKSCCKGDESDRKTCVNSWTSQPITNSSDLDIHTQGCYSLVSHFMDSNFGKIGGVAVGISFLQLFGAILACCLAKNINRAKYEQVA